MNLEKLRNASLHELRVRAAQRVAAFSERRGWSALVKLPDDEAFASLLTLKHTTATSHLLEYFRSRSAPCFFAGFQNSEKTAAAFKSRWPTSAQQLIDKANRICEGKFDLLGYKSLSFGEPIDWQFEPLTGKRIPLLHWSKLDYLDVAVAGDKKIIWELNRHQYFMTLGQAYWLTSDERYARVFATHLEAWMNANPPKLGINWASSLEVAFRSMSWLWAFYFFKSSPSLFNETFKRAWKFLYLNARHLESYLSTYFSPNTHLTGEALGLFFLGTMLPEFRAAKCWQDLGAEILIRQLPIHVQPDGVYFEQSSYYHRYTTDFYLQFLLLARSNNFSLPEQIEENLVLSLDHLMYITRPDGTTPLSGDDDGGRLTMLDVRPTNDFRGTLAIGAVMINSEDYRFVADEAAEELLWLTGVQGLNKFDAIVPKQPERMSVAFCQGGYFIMRDGWTRGSNYLLFDCGPHGSLVCGHAHADALSIELAAQGRTLLVDPGTFTYTGSKEMRDWFRSSVAHNTLTVDRESSSISADTFSWKTVTHCERAGWIDHARFTYVSGRHHGYERLGKPGTHTRSILFLKRDYWVMRDRIELSGKHQLDLWFHFESGTSPLVKGDSPRQWVHENGATSGLQIISFAAGGSWAKEEGWVSHCYGERAPAPVCVFSASAEDEFEITTFLIPEAKGTQARVEEIEVTGGRGFEVRTENSRDVVIIRNRGNAGVAQTASVISDFECTWLRFDGNDSTPAELVLLGGQKLNVAGHKIVESREPVEYSWLRKDAEQKIYVRN